MKISGMKVVDATKPVILTITKKDVENGNTKDPGACAAALAAMRQCQATAARVHIGRTYVKKGEKWVRYFTPKALRSEIIVFDRGGTFAPGEYILTPLPPSLKPVGKRTGGQSQNVRPRKPGKSRKKYHVVRGIRQHGANR